MCGISGIVSTNSIADVINKLQRMTDAIAHRGPDGEGHYVNEHLNIALGHRRLSIIDLSPEANQPMYFGGKYVMVFNGEIYNYIELRESLLKDGYTFKTQSDSEVLMALYDKYGKDCLSYLDGMFAFVICNNSNGDVFCARDRFGEKPFYFAWYNNALFFGSEMKCLWAAGVPKIVDQSMLFNYISYGSLFDTTDLTKTFYEGIRNLQHSHYLNFNITKINTTQKSYFSLSNQPIKIDFEEAKLEFRRLFNTSLTRRLRSDVPIGSSLSGGLDSSLIVCSINALNTDKLIQQNTFSAIFPGFEKDESKHIKTVVANTHANAHYVTPNETNLIAHINKLAYHQEEPFGSASIFAQYSVMELVKQNNVTVLLDGQGADEILAGYHKFYPSYLNQLKNSNPTLFAKTLKEYKEVFNKDPYNSKHAALSFLKRNFGGQLDTLRRMRERYFQMTEGQFTKSFFKKHIGNNNSLHTEFATLHEALTYATFSGFGLQELLRYADRNSMAHSREVRLPFLSHELAEFTLNLPAEFKLYGAWTKYIMRETFKDILPAEICWRKDKIGYEPPQASWMKNPTIKNAISNNRKKLVDAEILDPKIAARAVGEESAMERGGNEWRHWMAGQIIGNS